MLLIALIVVAAVVIRLMTVDERKKFLGQALEFGQQLRAARGNIRPCEPLRTNLRERTPRVFVAPAIATVLVFTFLSGNSQELANIGPQTTAGEWWRLVTAGFVAPSFGALVAMLIGFIQPALLLERLVGHTALAAVFVAAGTIAGAVQLSANPVGVNVAATAAVCGVYGLLAVAIASGAIRPSPVTVPFLAVKRMAPAMGLFLFYMISSGRYDASDSIGFIIGLGCGAVLAFRVGERKPPIRRIAAAVGATAVIAIGFAFSIGSIVDARPEIASVIEVERRTADAYNAAVDKFRQGRIKTDALVKLIELTIVPELQAAEKRVTALDSVPKEQQPLVTHAGEYLRLRSESWRLRSEGLKTTNMQRLRQAERTERESLGALEQIKPKTEPSKVNTEPAPSKPKTDPQPTAP